MMAAAGEEGAGTGLSVCVDQYDNGNLEAPAIDIKWRGAIIGHVSINKIQSVNWLPMTVTLRADGTLDVFLTNAAIYLNFQTPYSPIAGARFGFFARTGGEFETHWLDEVGITVFTPETSLSPLGSVSYTSGFDWQLPPGATLFGNAYWTNQTGVGNSAAVHLNDALGSQSGALVIEELTPLKPVNSFNASFQLRIGNGSGQPADGFSFNFANDLPNGTSASAEEGAGTGLSICLDNYQATGAANTSAMKVKWKGVQFAFVQIPTWNNTAFIPVSITLNANATLTVNVNGSNVWLNLPTPYLPMRGRFGMYARTGGEFETHWIDDLNITVPDYGYVTLSGGNVLYSPPRNNCGVDTFYYVVSDGQGGTVVDSVTVSIADITPPIVCSCATNRTLSANASCLAVIPDLTMNSGLVVTDSCSSVTVTQSPPAGTIVGLGNVMVTLYAFDASGNTSTCAATVTVADTTPPAINCPANISVNVDSGQCSAVVNFTVTASDNCTANPTIACAPASGFAFPAGTNTVTCRAWDTNGNTNTCSFTVTVADTELPTITCPANLTVNTDPGQCFATGVALGAPVTGDNCSVVVTSNAPSQFPLGPTTVVWTVRDQGGNTATCNQTVTVLDNQAPAITFCSPGLALSAGTNCQATLPDLTTTNYIVAVDNCSSVTITQMPPAGTVFALGTNAVVLTAFDAVGNATNCTNFVVVADTTAPTIICPPDVVVAADPGQCTASAVALGSPMTSDNCGVASVTNDAPAIYPVGLTLVTWTATDVNGNSASCIQRVTVTEPVPPMIFCPGNQTLKTTNLLGLMVAFTVSASDNCDANPTLICAPPSGTMFPVGHTMVHCTATDVSSNTAMCDFTVSVLLAESTNVTVNAAVPDNSSLGLASTIDVSSQIGNLTDVNVTLNISNGWNGDLYAYLVHDSGFAVLLNRVGRRALDPLGYNDSGFNITLDDQAANGDIHVYRLTLFGNHTTPLAGPLTNSWAPDGRVTDPSSVLDSDPPTALLNSFNGLNPNGSWTLFINDNAASDISTLVSWGLQLCGTVAAAPVIAQQPQNTTANCGSNATFEVGVAGSPPLSYQWFFGDTPIPGATGATVTLNNVTFASAGPYHVVVTNFSGGATSATVVLTIVEPMPPVITAQPQSRTNNVGTTATFSVSATSCGMIGYQWFFGASALTGETNATLSIANVQFVQAGNYTVKLSNTAGMTTSAVAVLTVNRPPVAQNNGGATAQNQVFNIATGKLLSNDSDPDGDPLTVISVSATSTNGGTVVLGGGYATYTPVNNFTGLDRFSYTISDGRGGTATADVEVLVVSGSLPGLNQITATPTANGVLIRFAGIPGRTYDLQRASAVTGPWSTLVSLTAPLHGIIEYEDTNPPMPAAFYRTLAP